MRVDAERAAHGEGAVGLERARRLGVRVEEGDEVGPRRAAAHSHGGRGSVVGHVVDERHVNYEAVGQERVAAHRVLGAAHGDAADPAISTRTAQSSLDVFDAERLHDSVNGGRVEPGDVVQNRASRLHRVGPALLPQNDSCGHGSQVRDRCGTSFVGFFVGRHNL